MHSKTPRYTLEFIVLQMQQSSLITCNEGKKKEEQKSGDIFSTFNNFKILFMPCSWALDKNKNKKANWL